MIGTDRLIVQALVGRALAWQERIEAYERAGCTLSAFERDARVLLAQFRTVIQYDDLLFGEGPEERDVNEQ